MIYHPTVKPAAHLVPHLKAIRKWVADATHPWVCEAIDDLYKEGEPIFVELMSLVNESLVDKHGLKCTLVTSIAQDRGAKVLFDTLFLPDGTTMNRKDFRLAWLDWMIANPKED